jgi:thiol-disulfide isomerase/thioredoxin
MKQFALLLIAFTVFITANAQKDTLPPYLQVPVIPAFVIQLTDSSMFAKKDIPKKIPVVMIYFNPECGHCQLEAQELVKNMDKFKKVFFVMAAYHDMEQIKEFASTYGLDKFSNVRIGRDSKYFIPVFYQVKTTPFSAVYDKKGNLLKAFPDEMSIEELEKALSISRKDGK